MSPEPQTQSKFLPVATVEDVILQEVFLQLKGLHERQYLLQQSMKQRIHHVQECIKATFFGEIGRTKSVDFPFYSAI